MKLVKLAINRDQLADAVAWTARALPTRPSIPVLTGLLLDASGDGLTDAVKRVALVADRRARRRRTA